MDEIINMEQTCAVKGRSVEDNVEFVKEYCRLLHEKEHILDVDKFRRE